MRTMTKMTVVSKMRPSCMRYIVANKLLKGTLQVRPIFGFCRISEEDKTRLHEVTSLSSLSSKCWIIGGFRLCIGDCTSTVWFFRSCRSGVIESLTTGAGVLASPSSLRLPEVSRSEAGFSLAFSDALELNVAVNFGGGVIFVVYLFGVRLELKLFGVVAPR